MTSIYQFSDFMEFPNLAFKLVMIKPFRHRGEQKNSRFAWIFFSVGAMNLIYQIFGMFVSLLEPRNESVDFILQISETGAVLGLTIVAFCKMFMLFWHRQRITQLIAELEDYFPSAEMQRQTTDEWYRRNYQLQYFAQSSRKLMKITAIFFMFAFFVYNTFPLAEILYASAIRREQFEYRYQSNTWYPWQDGSNNSILRFMTIYFCQFYSSLTGVAFIMSGEFMLCFFVTQMQLHYDFLARTLEDMDARKAAKHPENLRFCIDYHNMLIRSSAEINNIFEISFLTNFVTSSIAICLMCFSILKGINPLMVIKYCVGLLSFLVFTLFICYNGSELTKSSEKLHTAAFYHNWYDAEPSYRRMIMVIMMRAKKPTLLSAYKFSAVSMETFMKILKFSYQLFTFFRAMDI